MRVDDVAGNTWSTLGLGTAAYFCTGLTTLAGGSFRTPHSTDVESPPPPPRVCMSTQVTSRYVTRSRPTRVRVRILNVPGVRAAAHCDGLPHQ
jgi:hypothetical protein